MIKNLLFDLGGVIIDLKKDNCVAAFELLGLPDASKFFNDYGQKGPFMKIEDGSIDTEEFHKIIREYLPKDRVITDDEIDKAFSEFLVGIPDYRLGWLLELRRKYSVYLLSNTNPIMWDGRIAEEFRKDGLDIRAYFDGIVTSFEAKCLKPSPEIFEYTVAHLGINPKETLFMDDSLANLEAASKLGFKTLHVQAPEQEFMHVLKEHHYA